MTANITPESPTPRTYCGRCDKDTPTDADGKCPICTKYKVDEGGSMTAITPSDTPRADAAEIKVQLGFQETGTGQVPLEKARDIERLWNACKDTAKNHSRRIGELNRELAAKIGECDRLREELRQANNQVADLRGYARLVDKKIDAAIAALKEGK
jgi:hypothetical protein